MHLLTSKRQEQREKHASEIALIPLLQAEEDQRCAWFLCTFNLLTELYVLLNIKMKKRPES